MTWCQRLHVWFVFFKYFKSLKKEKEKKTQQDQETLSQINQDMEREKSKVKMKRTLEQTLRTFRE